MGFSPGTLSMASSDMNAACSGAPAANTAGTRWTVSLKLRWTHPSSAYTFLHRVQRVTAYSIQALFCKLGEDHREIFIRLSSYPRKDSVPTWSSGWTDSFQGAELCDGGLHVRQKGEGLSGTFLHFVLAVGSHQLLQPRPELPSLQTSPQGHSRTHLMKRVL